MSIVKIQGNASGTGTLTIAAPNTNSDRTISLPDSSGTFAVVDGSGNVTATTFTGNLTGNVTGNVSGNAGTVTNGVYTTGNQTIGGTKTFSSGITFGDATVQTTAATAPTTATVLAATAGASAGAVGTYGLMNQTNSTRYTQGATLAGSSLRFSDTTGGNSAGGATSSGTWRCMGTTDPFNTGTYNTLWLRIS